jgi:hypothetical protein
MRRLLTLSGCAILVGLAIACGDDVARMAGSALIDAGHALKDAGERARDGSAHAQAQCDTCNAPLKLAGPIGVVTAETDSDRIVGDIIPDTQMQNPGGSPNWQELAAGPIVITNLVHTGGAITDNHLGVADPGQCSSARPLVMIGYGDTTYASLTGLRMVVPKGKVLCGAGDGFARWAGFRPYEVDPSSMAAN